MISKNDEARKCANTNRASMSVTACKETNMNIVAKSDLNFHGVSLKPVDNVSGVWLTSSDIAKALGYASSKSVSTIYSRNSDEFTGSMSMVIKMKTIGINNNLREKSVRVFSLRGCHLIAMFATTDKAKDFRRWVLDVLDREVASGNVPAKFDFQMYVHNANVAVMHMEVIRQVWREELFPGLKKIGSPLATKLEDRIKDAGAIIYGIRNALERTSGYSGLQYK